jgi:hypothetical protein
MSLITINGGLTTDNNIYIKELSDNTLWYSTTDNSDDNTIIGIWTQININIDWQIVLNNTNIVKTETNRLILTLLTDVSILNINNYININTDYTTINTNNKQIKVSTLDNYTGFIHNKIMLKNTTTDPTIPGSGGGYVRRPMEI